MNFTILILGAVAGLTIFLGLPIGRMESPPPGMRAFLNATATGVLLFLLWDVLSKSVEPVTKALTAASVANTGSWATFAGLAATFAICVAAGLLSLVYYDRWMGQRAHSTARSGPGAMAATEVLSASLDVTGAARRLAMMIAIGIGMHNFSEGLAIGQSARSGAIGLAVVLIIGFGLHNATEGFGIVAPMIGQGVRPTWGFLGLVGIIGGAPTALGTFIGQSFVNDTLFLAFLALAAGSILYVIVQLVIVGSRMGRKEVLMWGLLVGLFAGFATDFILTAAGA